MPAGTNASGEASPDITGLLRRMDTGDKDACAGLVEALYPELRRIAEHRMSLERFDHTLQATGLVNEFFLRIARQEQFNWKNRAHFLAAASKAMRNVLIDYARRKGGPRRGGGLIRVQLEDLAPQSEFDMSELAAIGEVLDRLALEEPRMSQVIDMRCFGGLTFQEIAGVLDVDERTVQRDWQVAKAWLNSQLRRRNDVG